jgi:uncharacterized membrane protein required for colicin V production
MEEGILTSMIFFDIFIFCMILLGGFSGMRRGGLRTFFSLFWIYLSFICTSLLYGKIALSFQMTFDTHTPTVKLISFISVFVLSYIVTQLINIFLVKWIMKPVLTYSTFSNILGAVFGILEASIVIGIIFMNMSFYTIRPPLSESIAFNTMRQIPSKVAEYSTWFLPNSVKGTEPLYEIKKQRGIFDEDYGLTDGAKK